MKKIALGIMLATVSMSFAQSDIEPTHQLRQRIQAKKMMKVQPAPMQVDRKVAANDFQVSSRNEVKSSVTKGVIRVKNGTPFIDINNGRLDRRMMPVNFPKAMAIDGQEIQFRYTVSDLPLPKNGKCSMVINVFDVAVVKKR